jgi:uncharacterized protein YdeI (YjbR/CyaY-like superfamily)
MERFPAWQTEIALLRKIALSCGLTEEIKWGKPCFTHEGHNIAIIQPFKRYVALMFFKGALLEDPSGLLVPPGPNSRAARQLRFTELSQIQEARSLIKANLERAIEIEKAGLKIIGDEGATPPIPSELANKFKEMPALKDAFEALTPGRQREYLIYFGGAKQSTTRSGRIEKHIERILAGKGLRDR